MVFGQKCLKEKSGKRVVVLFNNCASENGRVVLVKTVALRMMQT